MPEKQQEPDPQQALVPQKWRGRELIIHKPTVPAEYADLEFVPDGNEDIIPSWPIIRVIQGTSKIKGSKPHIGQFWHSDRAEEEGRDPYTPELEVIVLQKKNGRSLFEDEADKVSCASNDGIVPRPNQPLWLKPMIRINKQELPPPMPYQPRTCAACPLSAWGANNEPPPCGEVMVLIVLRRDDGTTAMMRLSSTALSPYKEEMKKLNRKQLPSYTHTARMYTYEETQGQKNWMQLQVEMIPMPRAEVELVLPLVAEARKFFDANIDRAIDDAASAAAPAQREAVEWGNGEDVTDGPANAFQDEE